MCSMREIWQGVQVHNGVSKLLVFFHPLCRVMTCFFLTITLMSPLSLKPYSLSAQSNTLIVS